MDPMTMVGLGAGGALAMCWNHIKGFANRIIGLFIVTVTARSNLERSLVAYVWAKCRREQSCNRLYYSDYASSRKAGRSISCVFEEQGESASLCWLGRIPFLMKREIDKGTGGNNSHVRLTFIRGTINPDKLVLDANEFFRGNSAIDNTTGGAYSTRFYVHIRVGESKTKNKNGGVAPSNPCVVGYGSSGVSDRPVGIPMADLGYDSVTGTTTLALSDEVAGYVAEAKRWLNDRAWYQTRQVPWRRGWGIYGAPGNGKSSLVKGLGAEMDMPVYSLDLASMDNMEFRKFWDEATDHSPAIVVFEDFDNVFNGRTNIVEGSELTFDAILNAVSGVKACDGIFLIVTTNHVEHLDPALGTPGEMSSRPGRLDRVFEMKRPGDAGRRKLAERILFDHPGAVDATVAATDGMSGAQVQEFLTTEALKRKTT